MDTKDALETERCILCGDDTGVPTKLPTDARKHYINGVGQLCENCYIKVNAHKQDS